MEKNYGVVKTFKSGGSVVVTIPQDAVDELGITAGDKFTVRLLDQGLTYTKIPAGGN